MNAPPSVRWTAAHLGITPRQAAGLLRARMFLTADDVARWAAAPSPEGLSETGIRVSLRTPAVMIDPVGDDATRTPLGWRSRVGWECGMPDSELVLAAAAWWPWAADDPPAFLVATVAGGLVVRAWKVDGTVDVQPRGGRRRFALADDAALSAHFDGTRLQVRPGPVAAPLATSPQREAALLSATTARRDFIRDSME